MARAARPPRAGATQTLTIADWLPEPIANGSHGHWRVKQRKLEAAQLCVQLFAAAARWQRVPGRARLDIVLVFPQHRRRDTDNLYSRCKGLIDGLKGRYFEDDSTDLLDLHVTARVEPRRKAVELALTDLSALAQPTPGAEAGA